MGSWGGRSGCAAGGQFNALAAQCNAQATTCPTGQLAIVLDSTVISAPSISQPSYDRDQIQISGSFDEDEAKDLAAVLRNGPFGSEVQLVSVQHLAPSP